MPIQDRYSASGRPRPDPKTVCRGQCEGMGFYPTNDKSEWPQGAVPDSVGYVFVVCPDCAGTGRRDCEGKPVSPADIAKAVLRVGRAIGGDETYVSEAL